MPPGFIVASALLFATSAPAAVVEWKFYTYFAANDKPTEMYKAFADHICKASKKRLKIQVFASGGLSYKAADVCVVATDQIRMGDVALGFVAGDVQ
jgi:TRAP-type C4-dicarboxylate transport system substrate-binding protein